MNKEEFRSKVYGCWMGKNIGGTLGMPMEWERCKNDITYYTHDLNGEPLPNDDLDIQILWLLALEDRGIHVDAKDLGEYFNEFMIFTHAEYGVAKTNLRSGFQPPVTGSFNNDFKDSCGSYIRSEIWACLFPGHPDLAAQYAFEDAIVDHGDGEGVYAEVFIAAMESAAFYCRDIRRLIEIGLSYIPEGCAVGRGVRKAMETYDAGMDEKETREYIMQNFIGHLEWHYISEEDEEKGYTNGKMGWDVPSNIMIIIYGLLFGKGDFEKSILTAVHYGEDTDCTAGTIASLFGIMYGIEFFEEKWIEPIGRKIVTCSIDPFRMAGRIPATVEELTDRVLALHDTAREELALTEENREECFYAKPYFANIYDEMKTVKYEFPYLNVRLDYCGDPVITSGEPKKIKFILSNTSRSVTSDRVNVYLYNRDGCTVLPQNEASVFLTMAHMGAGIKELEYEISVEGPLKPIYRFAAEFTYEENKNRRVMYVPVVLVSETGTVREVKWEKKGPRGINNLPRI